MKVAQQRSEIGASDGEIKLKQRVGSAMGGLRLSFNLLCENESPHPHMTHRLDPIP
jgi:hypothetical protein